MSEANASPAHDKRTILRLIAETADLELVSDALIIFEDRKQRLRRSIALNVR